uniref:zinc finger C3HC-type protein 1 isoform X4 n=1 Tax=Myxine glutinosa TaxID=7769 RepID=UPI00358F9CA0
MVVGSAAVADADGAPSASALPAEVLQKVRRLICSFVASSTAVHQGNEQQVIEEEKSTSHNQDAFTKRLDTFTALSWQAKPDVLSPPRCARLGWLCTGPDMVRCSSCHAIICASLPPVWDIAHYVKCVAELEKALTTAHSSFCSWPEDPSPDWLLSPVISTSEAWTAWVARHASLSRIASELPILPPDLLTEMGLKPETLTAILCRVRVVREQNETAALLALCGWERSGSALPVLACTSCRRHAGLWNFHQVGNRADVVETDIEVETNMEIEAGSKSGFGETDLGSKFEKEVEPESGLAIEVNQGLEEEEEEEEEQEEGPGLGLEEKEEEQVIDPVSGLDGRKVDEEKAEPVLGFENEAEPGERLDKDADSGAELEMEAGSGSEMEVGSRSETEMGSVSETEIVFESEMEVGSGKEVESVSVFASEKEAKAESVSASEKEAEVESVPASEKEAEAESVSASEKEAEAESVSASEKEAEAESVSASEKEAEAESVSASEKEAEAESVSASEKEAEAESVSASEKEAEAEAESVSASEKEAEAEAESVSASEKEAEAEAESVSASEKEAEAVSASEKEAEARAESVSASEKEAEARAESVSASEKEAEAESVSASEKELMSVKEAEVQSMSASEKELMSVKEAEVQSMSASEKEARSEKEAELRFEKEVQPGSRLMEAETESGSDLEVVMESGSGLEVEAGSGLEAEEESRLGLKKKAGPGLENEIESMSEFENEAKSESDLLFKKEAEVELKSVEDALSRSEKEVREEVVTVGLSLEKEVRVEVGSKLEKEVVSPLVNEAQVVTASILQKEDAGLKAEVSGVEAELRSEKVGSRLEMEFHSEEGKNTKMMEIVEVEDRGAEANTLEVKGNSAEGLDTEVDPVQEQCMEMDKMEEEEAERVGQENEGEEDSSCTEAPKKHKKRNLPLHESGDKGANVEPPCTKRPRPAAIASQIIPKRYFHPLMEHRPWCPVVMQTCDSSRGAAISGWRVTLEAMLPQVVANAESEVKSPPQVWRIVHRALLSWQLHKPERRAPRRPSSRPCPAIAPSNINTAIPPRVNSSTTNSSLTPRSSSTTTTITTSSTSSAATTSSSLPRCTPTSSTPLSSPTPVSTQACSASARVPPLAAAPVVSSSAPCSQAPSVVRVTSTPTSLPSRSNTTHPQVNPQRQLHLQNRMRSYHQNIRPQLSLRGPYNTRNFSPTCPPYPPRHPFPPSNYQTRHSFYSYPRRHYPYL